MLAEVVEQALEAAQESVERGPELLAGAARARRRRRRRLRGHAARRRAARRPARRGRAARGRAPRRAARTPRPPARGERVPVLHELRRLGRRPRAGPLIRPGARGDRRLGARRRGPRDASRARPHRPSGPGGRALRRGRRRSSASTSRTCTSSRSSAPRASRKATTASRSQVKCGVVAVAAGDGMKRLYRELGAHVVEGGSSLNPSTFELLAGIHGVAADEVIVLPNSPQRDHGRRPRRRALGEDRRGRRVALAAGGAGLPRGAQLRAHRRRERGQAFGGARRDPGRRSRAGRARRQAGALSRRRRGRLRGRRDRRLGRRRARRSARSSGASRDGSEVVTCIAGDGAPLDEAEIVAIGRVRPPTSRSSASMAGRRTTGGCSPPSRSLSETEALDAAAASRPADGA